MTLARCEAIELGNVGIPRTCPVCKLGPCKRKSAEPKKANFSGLMKTALWTEIREAIVKDFPDLDVPLDCPENLKEVVISNVNYMIELINKT